MQQLCLFIYVMMGKRLQYSSLQNRLLVNYRSTVPVDLLYSLILDICVNIALSKQLNSARFSKGSISLGRTLETKTQRLLSVLIIV